MRQQMHRGQRVDALFGRCASKIAQHTIGYMQRHFHQNNMWIYICGRGNFHRCILF